MHPTVQFFASVYQVVLAVYLAVLLYLANLLELALILLEPLEEAERQWLFAD